MYNSGNDVSGKKILIFFLCMFGLISTVFVGWDLKDGINTFTNASISEKSWFLSGVVAYISLPFIRKLKILFFLLLVVHFYLSGVTRGFAVPLGGLVQGPNFSGHSDWLYPLGEFYATNFQWLAGGLVGFLLLLDAADKKQTLELAMQNSGHADSLSNIKFYWQAEPHPENNKRQDLLVATKTEIILIPYSSATGATKDSVALQIKDIEKIEFGLVHNRRWEGRVYYPEKYLLVAISMKDMTKHTRLSFLGTKESDINLHYPEKISQIKSLDAKVSISQLEEKETETGRKLVGGSAFVFETWD